LEKGDNIPNVGGYLRTMVAQTSLFDSVEDKKQQQKAKVQKAKEQAAKKAELEAQRKQLQAEKYAATQRVIDLILGEISEAAQIGIDGVKGGMFGKYYEIEKSLAENLENSFFKSAFGNVIKNEFSGRFEVVNEQFDGKIKEVKNQIAKM